MSDEAAAKPGEMLIKDATGRIASAPVDYAQGQIAQGLAIPTSQQDISKYNTTQEFSGLGGGLEAAGIGVAGSVPYLGYKALEGVGVSPETIEGAEQQRPLMHMAGMIAGLGAQSLLGEAPGIVGVAAKFNPAHLAEMAGEGLASVAGKRLAPYIGRAASNIAASTLGSSIEGAYFGGLHQTANEIAIHEDMLGDPKLVAEKIAANGASGALIGASFGALKGVSKEIFEAGKGVASRVSVPSVKRVLGFVGDTSKLEDDAAALGASDKVFKTLDEAPSNVSPKAQEIVDAAKDLGVNLKQEYVLDGDQLLETAKSINNSDSIIGENNRTQDLTNLSRIQKAVEETNGDISHMSPTKLVEDAKESLRARFSEENQNLSPMWKQIMSESTFVEPNPRSVRIRMKRLLEDAPTSEAAQSIAKDIESRVSRAKSVTELHSIESELKSQMRDLTTTGLQKVVLSDAVSHIKNIIVKSVRSDAERMIKESHVQMPEMQDMMRKKAENWISTLKDLEQKTREWNEHLDNINRSFGGKKLPNGIGPEGKMERLFGEHSKDPVRSYKSLKNNIKGQEYLKENHPEIFQDAMRNYRGDIFRNSLDENGNFNVQSFFKNLRGINEDYPEFYNNLYTPAQQKIHSQAALLQGRIMRTAITNPQAYNVLKWISPKLGMAQEGYHFAKNSAFRYYSNEALSGAGFDTDKLFKLSALERGASQTTAAIESGVKKIVNTLPSTIKPIEHALEEHSYVGEDMESKYKKIVKEINSASESPEALIDRLHGSVQHLSEHAPNISNNLMIQGALGLQFLKNKIPVTQPPGIMTKPLPVSKPAMNTFMKYHSAVMDPVSVLKNVASGTVTHEHIDALQSVYPALYQEMKSKLMDGITKNGAENIPLHLRTSISAFMGGDVDGSMSQQTIMSNQLALNQNKVNNQTNQMTAQGSIKPTSGGMGKIDSSGRMMTAMQGVAARGMNG